MEKKNRLWREPSTLTRKTIEKNGVKHTLKRVGSEMVATEKKMIIIFPLLLFIQKRVAIITVAM